MKKTYFIVKLLSLLFILICFSLPAQKHAAFWDDIQQFKKIDAENPPKQDAILFIGSSSFTKWQDVGNYFPDKTIINRGFGGSSLADLNFYANDLLAPYHPKQIVIYCGENDFAGNEKLTSQEVYKRYKIFYRKIRSYYPNIPVDYISIKLSPSRRPLWSKFTATNTLIKNFMTHKKNAEYIDVTKAMQDSQGNVRRDIFLQDMLHMTPEGYQIWKKQIDPYLK